MKPSEFEKDLLELEKDIVAKAKSAYLQGLIRGVEWKDIAQEYRLALLINWNKYDPKRAGKRTFAVAIMNHKTIDLIRKSSVRILG